MKESDKKKLQVFGLVIAMIVVWSFVFGSGSPRNKASSTSSSSSDQSTMAYIMSQDFVERYLKAPASAKFPWSASGKVNRSNGYYVVNAHVDAQNSFGAMLRQNYTAKLKYVGGDQWNCEYLAIDGQVYISN